MATFEDIPEDLKKHPNRFRFINWINNNKAADPITRNQLLTLYSKATGIKFPAEDFARITTTS